MVVRAATANDPSLRLDSRVMVTVVSDVMGTDSPRTRTRGCGAFKLHAAPVLWCVCCSLGAKPNAPQFVATVQLRFLLSSCRTIIITLTKGKCMRMALPPQFIDHVHACAPRGMLHVRVTWAVACHSTPIASFRTLSLFAANINILCVTQTLIFYCIQTAFKMTFCL